jgi:hypothetical protein
MRQLHMETSMLSYHAVRTLFDPHLHQQRIVFWHVRWDNRPLLVLVHQIKKLTVVQRPERSLQQHDTQRHRELKEGKHSVHWGGIAEAEA